MEKLKVLENDIVPVYTTDTGEKVVYGSELHKALSIQAKYADWAKRRFDEVDAIENEDFEVLLKNEKNPCGGRPSKDHIIKLDTAKEMAMLERNAKGKQVRRYFIAIEKKYKGQAAPPPTLEGQVKAIASYSLELKEMITEVGRKADETSAQVQEMRKEVESRFEDLPILGVEEKQITAAVRRAAVRAIGGVKSNAYRDRSIRAALFSDVYRQLYRNFEVSTYKAIKRSQCGTALEVIEGYEPPLMLKGRIDAANAQETLPGTA